MAQKAFLKTLLRFLCYEEYSNGFFKTSNRKIALKVRYLMCTVKRP